MLGGVVCTGDRVIAFRHPLIRMCVDFLLQVQHYRKYAYSTQGATWGTCHAIYMYEYIYVQCSPPTSFYTGCTSMSYSEYKY